MDGDKNIIGDKHLTSEMDENGVSYAAKRDEVSRDIRDFTKSDLFLRTTDPTHQYSRRLNELKRSLGWGQLKLFTAMVEALIYFWKKDEVPNLIVVYAGAAPGHNISIISEWFPEVEFHLYDPADFGIKPTDRIHIYTKNAGMFTDEVARSWTSRASRVFFFSDIRSVNSYTNASDVIEREIWKDMEAQSRWVKIMNPYRAHLKCRFPYVTATTMTNPRTGDYTVDYLNGYILWQSFAGPTSTETRLVPVRNSEGAYHDKSYNFSIYEQRCFWHNAILRDGARYRNPIDGTEKLADGRELRLDYDGTQHLYIMDKYLIFRGDTTSDPRDRARNALALSRDVRRILSSFRKKPVSMSIIREAYKQAIRSLFIKDDEDTDDLIDADDNTGAFLGFKPLPNPTLQSSLQPSTILG